MAFDFKHFLKGINLVANSTSEVSVLGDIDVTQDGKLNYHNGSGASPLVTESGTATLTNKSIDGGHNTLTNIPDSALSNDVVIGPGSASVNTIGSFINTSANHLQSTIITASSNIISTLTGNNLQILTQTSSDRILMGLSPNALLAIAPSSNSIGVLLSPYTAQSMRVAGYTNSTGNGSSLNLRGGDSTFVGGTGGTLTINGGNSLSSGVGAAVTIFGGSNSASGIGGTVTVSGGNNSSGGGGGDVFIKGGYDLLGLGAGGTIHLNTGVGTSGVPGLTIDSFQNVIVGPTGASQSTTSTNQFFFLPSCNGNPSGIPAAASGGGHGKAALIYDNANNLLFAYNGGWQQISSQGGTISGLVNPASATFNSTSASFIWQSNTNTAATMDAASYIIRKTGISNSPGITLGAPSSLASNYSLTLPVALPASQSFATIDGSGNIAAPWAVDNSTIEVSGGTTVQVKNSGITGAKLATNIDLPGTTPTVNGGFAIVSGNANNASRLIVTRGSVNSTGTVVSGEGFSSSLTNSTNGDYTITFTTAFTTAPCVTVTSNGVVGPKAVDAVCVTSIVSVSTTNVVIRSYAGTSSLVANAGFSFIAVGT